MEKSNDYWTIKDLFEKRQQIEFPEYQREANVWNLEKKQRLIDSILRGIDIASIYLFQKEKDSYDCVDGNQRINAILSYLNENPTDKEDNGFHVTMRNEIFEDSEIFANVNDKRFDKLPGEYAAKFWNYKISTVIIEKVENDEELNLFFLRLQLGQILNAGEKLHAMIGKMRDFIFSDIGLHRFFEGISIPYRRYAREQVAAQITLNYFSKREKGAYHTTRYIDLQEFFKGKSKFNKHDKDLTNELKLKLDKISDHFKETLGLITNRAIAVSVFLFISEMIDQGKEKEIKKFERFFIKLVKTLKWQVSKGVHMDEVYHYLLDFQTYVTQATGEKYAVQRRYDFLDREFSYYKSNKVLKGDTEYLKATGRKPDGER